MKRSELITLDIQPGHLRVMDERLAPLMALSLRRFNMHVPLAHQLRDIARSAYHQGLIDGAQVGQKMAPLESVT